MTDPTSRTGIVHLTERQPTVTGPEMLASLVPPPQFDTATFDSYRADPAYPSQEEAKETLMRFSGRKYFGSFIEYTALVGALGYKNTVDLLKGADLLCIDEFELDDPGDTMVMTRLIGELVPTGTRLAATSNTPPNALGEGRFAAQDFLREIHAMSDSFQMLRIDGVDFRQRALDGHAVVLDDGAYAAASSAAGSESTASDDRFDDLIRHLAQVHPSRYIRLIEGLGQVGLRDVRQLTDQSEALRFVAFVDRVYDAQIPIIATGLGLDSVFSEEMLAGGYRKKYLRAVSRLNALTHSA
ncbi:MAG: cell division protein ZapE [Microbacterium sp.]|nr:cell division protein ZapE [Microbacterium sp.]